MVIGAEHDHEGFTMHFEIVNASVIVDFNARDHHILTSGMLRVDICVHFSRNRHPQHLFNVHDIVFLLEENVSLLELFFRYANRPTSG